MDKPPIQMEGAVPVQQLMFAAIAGAKDWDQAQQNLAALNDWIVENAKATTTTNPVGGGLGSPTTTTSYSLKIGEQTISMGEMTPEAFTAYAQSNLGRMFGSTDSLENIFTRSHLNDTAEAFIGIEDVATKQEEWLVDTVADSNTGVGGVLGSALESLISPTTVLALAVPLTGIFGAGAAAGAGSMDVAVSGLSDFFVSIGTSIATGSVSAIVNNTTPDINVDTSGNVTGTDSNGGGSLDGPNEKYGSMTDAELKSKDLYSKLIGAGFGAQTAMDIMRGTKAYEDLTDKQKGKLSTVYDDGKVAENLGLTAEQIADLQHIASKPDETGNDGRDPIEGQTNTGGTGNDDVVEGGGGDDTIGDGGGSGDDGTDTGDGAGEEGGLDAEYLQLINLLSGLVGGIIGALTGEDGTALGALPTLEDLINEYAPDTAEELGYTIKTNRMPIAGENLLLFERRMTARQSGAGALSTDLTGGTVGPDIASNARAEAGGPVGSGANATTRPSPAASDRAPGDLPPTSNAVLRVSQEQLDIATTPDIVTGTNAEGGETITAAPAPTTPDAIDAAASGTNLGGDGASAADAAPSSPAGGTSAAPGRAPRTGGGATSSPTPTNTGSTPRTRPSTSTLTSDALDRRNERLNRRRTRRAA